MNPGTKVHVTGARSFAGTVLAAFDDALVIEELSGISIILRRDPFSTAPGQWRCIGLPVEVRVIPNLSNLAEFRARLWALERRTRP